MKENLSDFKVSTKFAWLCVLNTIVIEYIICTIAHNIQNNIPNPK